MAHERAGAKARGYPGPIARAIIGDGPRASQIRAQYDALKRDHADRVLFVQIGDFYETFEGDAQIVARVCDITLTSKEFAKGDRVPLAGVPVARAAPHIGKLVAAGYHVAICDQIGEAGKGLVERQVTRIITPGTVAEPGLVPPQEHNLLVALLRGREGVGLACADVTTGEVLATVVAGPELEGLLAAELQRLSPSEVLVVRDEPLPPGMVGHVTVLDRARFDPVSAGDELRRLYGVGTLDGYGLPAASPALGSLGALVGYVGEANHRLLASLREPRAYVVGSHMTLDPSTRRNLELSRTARSGQTRGSLVHTVDRTRTPMGSRGLRRVLGQPLLDRPALGRRFDAVEELVDDPIRRGRLRSALGKLGDVERLFGRVRQLTASPRDAFALARAVRELPHVREAIQPADSALLRVLADALVGCESVAEAIEAALAEPGTSRTIRPGHSPELDELIDGIGEARIWLAHLERRERERTGIRSLRVGFNRVSGYYIEVTRPNLKSIPADYMRRQSLVNAERFVTPELKEREARILTAEARIEELEHELFVALLRRVGELARPILAATEALADLDVLAALADVAAERGWTRPTLVDGDELTIVGGRHPVLEALLPPGDVIPNECRIGGDAAGRVLIVTGPNMGGKSTYLRQAALIVLLAQAGSFVPAERATIGLVDRLFTRVGSQDDLVAGASTFLVEMAETANILRHATGRSLVVLDEVGRGTSTHDGLCIAQAVVEHLHDSVGARTLFATHFHELTALTETLTAVRNVTVAVDEADEELAFLYRVVPGAANKSYGVQVARLAGLPSAVTARAAELLRVREAPRFEEIVAGEAPTSNGWAAHPPASDGPIDAAPLLLDPFDAAAPSAWTDGYSAGVVAIREPAPPVYSAEPVPPVYVADAVPQEYSADAVLPNESDGASHDLTTQAHAAPPATAVPVATSPATAVPVATSPATAVPVAASPDSTSPVAARLLGDILALDLSSLTPLQALIRLHALQEAARGGVPWQAWLAGLASADAPARSGNGRAGVP